MVGNNEKSILQTLAYADIFDYPLTRDEIWRFLISRKKTSEKSIQETLNEQINSIAVKNGYYALAKRTHIIDKRIEREDYSSRKFLIAHKISSYISCMPSVLLVGVSGGLAMKNVAKEDDIDFFVITKTGTVWLTRLVILIILEFFRVRRKRLETDVADKICLNMLLDEDSLCISYAKQNLYSAHEVAQMIPLFQRNTIYQRFIHENAWTETFLPNALSSSMYQALSIKQKKGNSLFLFASLLAIGELVAKKIQLWHIAKHKTEEVTKDNLLAFYPSDYHNKVLTQYKKRLAQYKIL